MTELETYKKLPLGGVDRRAMVTALATDGLRVARELLATQRKLVRSSGTSLAKDTAVLILGGSNGITRAVALHLLFGEKVPVYGVHYDSEKMQIGAFHVQAMKEEAAKEGVACEFWNEDATKESTVETVVNALKGKYRAVHVINGVAAGATKRYAEHGPTKVKDVDVAFDTVLQVPDFSKAENIRKVGLVDVEVATDVDIERTNKFMGTSTLFWAEPLAKAGLIAKGESLVGFCDYDYPADDPVYAMGPLAGAKKLQRKTMTEIHDRFGARTVRICYPPVATTALGAIPGGLLMYGLSAEILKEQGKYRDVLELGADTMAMFKKDFTSNELRLDTAYQAQMEEFHKRKDALTNEGFRDAFKRLYG